MAIFKRAAVFSLCSVLKYLMIYIKLYSQRDFWTSRRLQIKIFVDLAGVLPSLSPSSCGAGF